MFLEQKNKTKLYMLVKSTRERSLTSAKAHSILTRKKNLNSTKIRFKYPTTVSIFIVRESKITEHDYLRNLLKRYLNFHCEKIIELHIDNTRNGNKNSEKIVDNLFISTYIEN